MTLWVEKWRPPCDISSEHSGPRVQRWGTEHVDVCRSRSAVSSALVMLTSLLYS